MNAAFRDAHTNRIVGALQILLVLGIGYTLASAGVYFVADARSDGAPPIADSQAEKASIGIDGIVAANLFGRVAANAVNVPEVELQPPDSRLELTLEGVFQARDPQRSTAIVAEKSKPGQLYAIGATIYGNAMLARVTDDHIVLRRAGSFETLRFPDVSHSFASSSPDDSPVLADPVDAEVPSPNASYDPSRDELAPPLPSPGESADQEVTDNG